MDYIGSPTPNSYVDALSPSVLIFIDGTLSRKLDLDKVMRMAPHDGICAFIKKTYHKAFFFSTHEHRRGHVNVQKVLSTYKAGREA